MEHFNETYLTCIKHVLFGLQKQANVINDAVVTLVAKELASKMDVVNLSTTGAVDLEIQKYVAGCMAKTISYDENILMLIVGEQSVANMSCGEPITLVAENISDTSPKMLYRIAVLGKEADIERPVELGDTTVVREPMTPMITPDGFWERACAIRDRILPTVPQAVKDEINGNEFAQCLVCAEQYFKY
jgi:hypothetical protein